MTNDVSAKTNPTAVLALILGILLSPVALPLGWFAREQIRRSREKGMRLCVAAMALGAISIPVWITGGVVFYLWWSTL